MAHVPYILVLVINNHWHSFALSMPTAWHDVNESVELWKKSMMCDCRCIPHSIRIDKLLKLEQDLTKLLSLSLLHCLSNGVWICTKCGLLLSNVVECKGPTLSVILLKKLLALEMHSALSTLICYW